MVMVGKEVSTRGWLPGDAGRDSGLGASVIKASTLGGELRERGSVWCAMDGLYRLSCGGATEYVRREGSGLVRSGYAFTAEISLVRVRLVAESGVMCVLFRSHLWPCLQPPRRWKLRHGAVEVPLNLRPFARVMAFWMAPFPLAKARAWEKPGL